MEKIKLGYIPTRRNVFSREEAVRYRNEIKKELLKYSETELVDIDDMNEEGLLFNEADLPAIVRKMKMEDVDGVFFPHCNFGTEDLVAKVARAIGKPVLIWGPRDDAPLADGLRTRDTQCGLFATGKVLRRFQVPFTYIENCKVTDEAFLSGFDNFIRVCAVIKSLGRLNILQIGPRPDGFWSVICNEGELIEKFDFHIFPISLIDLADEVYAIMDAEDEEYTETLERIRQMMLVEESDSEDAKKAAALKVAIQRLCRRHNCNCVSLQCWNALQSGLGIMPCMVNGLLMEENIPVVCEMDVHGAVTAVMLQSAGLGKSPVFFADVTVRHPENENAELFWHCGNFSPSLAKEGQEKKAGHHFIFPEHLFGTGEWEIKGGDVTICRFDGDNGEYRMFIGEGRGTDGPKTKGTYLWVEVENWPKWERTLVEGPYIHHCTGLHGKYGDVLEEAAKYIGIQVDRMKG